MLLHKRRIEGSLFGLGVQNPYGADHLYITDIAPLKYDDYVKNLKLVSNEETHTHIEQEKDDYKEQAGSGISLDQIASAGKLLYQGVKAVSDFYSSKTGTSIKNYYGKYINPNPNFRPQYPGEKHAIMSGTIANFLGPGTQIEKRIARNDPPLDGSHGIDNVARTHDIEYMNAKSLDDVRKADLKFVRDAKKSSAKPVIKAIATNAIRAKMVAENLGILDKNKFSNIPIASNEDTPLYGQGKKTKKLKKVRAMGKYPDSYIRNKLMKEYGKSRKKLASKVN